MPKYRKKPVVIEAFQMTHDAMDSDADWPQWLHKAFKDKRFYNYTNTWLRIPWEDGMYYVEPNDFIIQGVQGELYPCKPDIFAETYEAV